MGVITGRDGDVNGHNYPPKKESPLTSEEKGKAKSGNVSTGVAGSDGKARPKPRGGENGVGPQRVRDTLQRMLESIP